MIFPVIFLGACLFVIVSLKDNNKSRSSTEVRGNPINITNHLSEFTMLIRNGHKPSQWLVIEAISEAYNNGDWKLAQAISDAYANPVPEIKKEAEKPAEKTVEAKPEVEAPEVKQLEFNPSLTTSPIDGISNDDWRMFIEVSKIESASFDKNNAIGMFRQNKKRLQKLGVDPKDIQDPLKQYDAFEMECVQLLSEGKNLIKQSVAMPVEVDGESIPVTLSGLLTVMHHAGVDNAAKWLDSIDERKKFPNTTEAFKRSNGCF